MLLPSREPAYQRRDGSRAEPLPATSAETYEDIAGIGRRHMGLALAMAVCCFSLIGLPATIGFFGKLYLIQPALGVGTSKMNWLVVLTVVNAAIGAAYYLRIVATMFLRPEPVVAGAPARTSTAVIVDETRSELGRPWWASPVGASIMLSVALTLLFGAVFPATSQLSERSYEASYLDPARATPRTVVADSNENLDVAPAASLTSVRP
jgi:NADH-quinone oxidoreductase subunit N